MMSNSNNDGSFPDIQLKGMRYGIRVVFPVEISDDVLFEKFASIPKEAYVFPVGCGVALDFQSRPVSGELIAKILSLIIWTEGINVLAWLTTDEETAVRLRNAGFQVTEPKVSYMRKKPETLILPYSLRSGQHQETEGDMVLVGHLNNGAEIYAGGSVSVLGRLKGLVHAGREGTEGVYILAASLEAQQLRIGDRMCSRFTPDMKWWKKPVIITLEENGLLLRDWKTDSIFETTP